ncbi:protein of unknown function [Hyphomicrobium sp. 1Nfss2.1]
MVSIVSNQDVSSLTTRLFGAPLVG